MGEVILAVN